MGHKEIENYRKGLQEIIDRPPQPDGNPAKGTKEDLQKLAKKIGASTRSWYVHPTTGEPKGYDAGISDLIDNIHQALQTLTMIDMCETAARNFWIVVVAAIAAASSAVTAWVAVCK